MIVLKPALSKDSLVSEILFWMTARNVDGFTPKDCFAMTVSRHLHLQANWLTAKLQTHLPTTQVERAQEFATAHGISFLEAAMSIPVITPEQYDEVEGELVLLHRRNYVWMSDVNDALFEALMEDIRQGRLPRGERDALLSIPMFNRRMARALLMTLINPDWPLPSPY